VGSAVPAVPPAWHPATRDAARPPVQVHTGVQPGGVKAHTSHIPRQPEPAGSASFGGFQVRRGSSGRGASQRSDSERSGGGVAAAPPVATAHAAGRHAQAGVAAAATPGTVKAAVKGLLAALESTQAPAAAARDSRGGAGKPTNTKTGSPPPERRSPVPAQDAAERSGAGDAEAQDVRSLLSGMMALLDRDQAHPGNSAAAVGAEGAVDGDGGGGSSGAHAAKSTRQFLSVSDLEPQPAAQADAASALRARPWAQHASAAQRRRRLQQREPPQRSHAKAAHVQHQGKRSSGWDDTTAPPPPGKPPRLRDGALPPPLKPRVATGAAQPAAFFARVGDNGSAWRARAGNVPQRAAAVQALERQLARDAKENRRPGEQSHVLTCAVMRHRHRPSVPGFLLNRQVVNLGVKQSQSEVCKRVSCGPC
jgi:hypothetical protein